MKQKHINTKSVVSNLPTPSEAFYQSTMTQLEGLASREEIPMKRKAFTSIVITAVLLVVLAATALAAQTLFRSAEADAISKARRALVSQYGLSPETLGLFYPETAQDGKNWTVVFRPEAWNPQVLGDYTVVLNPDRDPSAAWTHDSVDPTLWQGGNLDAPVWGQGQLLEALQNPEAARQALTARENPEVAVAPRLTPPPPSAPMGDDEIYAEGYFLKLAVPAADVLPQEEAVAIARQAALEETAIALPLLNDAVPTARYYQDDMGHAQWHLRFTVVDKGIKLSCTVIMDAKTGEILHTSVSTGETQGNG